MEGGKWWNLQHNYKKNIMVNERERKQKYENTEENKRKFRE
jgi:hypothetical protein